MESLGKDFLAAAALSPLPVARVGAAAANLVVAIEKMRGNAQVMASASDAVLSFVANMEKSGDLIKQLGESRGAASKEAAKARDVLGKLKEQIGYDHWMQSLIIDQSGRLSYLPVLPFGQTAGR